MFAYIELEIQPNISEEESELVVKTPKKPESSINFDRKSNRANVIEFDFDRNHRFDDYYNEFRNRKNELKRKKKRGSLWSKEEDEEEDLPPVATNTSSQAKNLKIIRNPNIPEEVEEIEDDYGEDILYSIESIPFEILWSVEQTIENALSRGVLLGSPMQNVKVKLIDMNYSLKRSNPMIFQMATVQLLKEMFSEAEPQIMEPVMDMEISAPSSFVQELLNDVINMRRGKVLEIIEEGGRFDKSNADQRSLIYAVLPLESTIGYATFLRTLTKVFFFNDFSK